ncbi:MAG: alpha/beta hydrolase [Myxococcota bacterium]
MITDFDPIWAEQTALFEELETSLPSIYFADVFNGAFACPFWSAAMSPQIDWPTVFEQQGPQFEILFVDSTGDTRAPRAFADALSLALPEAARVRVDEFSHSVSLQGINNCVDERVQTFLTGETGAVMGTIDCPKSVLP